MHQSGQTIEETDRAGVKYDFVFMYKISEKETGCACDAKIHTSTLEHKAG
ncbi:MAG: hypothetical protein MSA59_08490 [Lachnobacterium sp.]|nr:hypothetical protein [Lachnobacterium sp.]